VTAASITEIIFTDQHPMKFSTALPTAKFIIWKRIVDMRE
jgi:hypothetical protein